VQETKLFGPPPKSTAATGSVDATFAPFKFTKIKAERAVVPGKITDEIHLDVVLPKKQASYASNHETTQRQPVTAVPNQIITFSAIKIKNFASLDIIIRAAIKAQTQQEHLQARPRSINRFY
jgi:hypothetical protein